MCVFELLLSADLSLGRVDYILLSDQTLMEMLIDGLDDETKKKYQDNNGIYLDVCEWSVVKCDDALNVIEMQIFSEDISGLLDLCYVPPKVKVLYIGQMPGGELTWSVDLTQLPCGMEELYLYNNQLAGVVDLTQLPGGMETLGLSNNQLTGAIDLTQLPGGMETLLLHNNQLTGVVDLTQLPGAMTILWLQNNQFTGAIDLTQLPGEMKELYLHTNQLTGAADLTQLPGGMTMLRLNDNKLTGEIDLTHLPDGMKELYLQSNRFSGSFVIKRFPPGINLSVMVNRFNAVAVVDSQAMDAFIVLQGSGVTSVVDENGEELDMKQFIK